MQDAGYDAKLHNKTLFSLLTDNAALVKRTPVREDHQELLSEVLSR